MILDKFKTGWQKAFERKVRELFEVFPDLQIESVERAHGLLRIKLLYPLDKRIQDIVNCVTYKIERESATICESCGNRGTRRIEHLPEKMYLCWKCYALEIDALQTQSTE